MTSSRKRYLKQDYSTHVVHDSTKDSSSVSPDHCRYFALSDPKKDEFRESCTHSHSIECDRCEELRHLFASLDEAIGNVYKTSMVSDERNDLQFLLNDSKDKIEQWKSHILRSVNQDEGKKDVLDGLAPNEVLLVEDWAMKFLPLFREKSSEFYGKRGINWHVTAVIRKTEQSILKVEVFVHIFNNCHQNQMTVTAINQDTLSTLKKLYPELSGAYIRSDNAGCYHGGYLLTGLSSVGRNNGIKVIGYDFSEAQHGKDICDRKTATMKQHARRYVAETKTDILTAFDLKRALGSNGGVKGCRVSVVEMPKGSTLVDTNIRISGISQIHNIRYTDDGMRYWEAYGVGKGEWLENDATLSVSIPKLNVLEAFSSECLNTGIMAEISKCSGEKISDATVEKREGRVSFDCPIDGCICSYKSDAELQKHLDISNHVRRLHRESQFDHIKRQYADMVSDELSKPLFGKSTFAEQNKQTVSKVTMGWALKKQKSSTRFPEKVKTYLMIDSLLARKQATRHHQRK